MTPAADERIEDLYGLPLERFTAERNALAAELRAAGEHERATAVKALRKPTAAAWAVNQLVRAEPELVEALLGAGGELRQAHRQAASGRGAAQLRAAAEAERAAVDALMERAARVLGRPVGAALGEAIRNTLHAASSGDDARERVRSGTLTTELRPIGLGPIPSGAVPEPRERKQADKQAEARRRRSEEAEARRQAKERDELLRAARAAEAALRREADAAARALDRAEQAHTRAQATADVALERVREARRRLRDARAGFTDAERRRSRLERED